MVRKLYLITLICVLYFINFSSLLAETDIITCPAETKMKSFAEEYNVTAMESAISIAATKDNGVVVAGTTIPAGMMEDADIFISKLDGSGNNVWTKIIQGPANAGDEAVKIIATSSGYLLAGYTVSADTNGEKVLLVKITDDGVKTWAVTLGDGSFNRPLALTQTSDSGYAVLSERRIPDEGDAKELILYKLNNSGAVSWSKNLGNNETAGLNSIAKTSDNGMVLLAQGIVDNYSNTSSSFSSITKLNANGGKEWSKIMETIPLAMPTANGTYDNFRWSPAVFSAITQTDDGDYLATGQIYSSLLTNVQSSDYSAADIFVTKLDNQGRHKWTETYNFGGIEKATGMVKLSDGYLILGESYSNYLDRKLVLFKINSSGNVKWQKLISGPEGADIAVASDGGYFLSGQKNDNPYVIKVDAAGDLAKANSLISTTDVKLHDRTRYVLLSNSEPAISANSANSSSYALSFLTTSISPQFTVAVGSAVPACKTATKLLHGNPDHPKTWIEINYEKVDSISLSSKQSKKANAYLLPALKAVFEKKVKIKDEMTGALLDYQTWRKITKQDVRDVRAQLTKAGFNLIDRNKYQQITMSGNGLTLVITFNVDTHNSALIEVTF